MAIHTTLMQDKQIGEALMPLVEISWGDMSDLLDYIQVNFAPEDIYDRGELDEWAIDHDYIKA